MDLKLKPHEQAFSIKPVGIKYICEFCHEGEMIRDKNGPRTTLLSNPPFYQHVCTKCGKIMHLPKIYPYVEWIDVNDQIINQSCEEES